MAAKATVGKVEVQLEADTRRFNREMKKAAKTVGQSGKQMEKGVAGVTKKMQSMGSSVTLVQGPLSGIGARFQALNAIMGRSGLQIAGILVGLAGITALSKAAIGQIGLLLESGLAQVNRVEIEQ